MNKTLAGMLVMLLMQSALTAQAEDREERYPIRAQLQGIADAGVAGLNTFDNNPRPEAPAAVIMPIVRSTQPVAAPSLPPASSYRTFDAAPAAPSISPGPTGMRYDMDEMKKELRDREVNKNTLIGAGLGGGIGALVGGLTVGLGVAATAGLLGLGIGLAMGYIVASAKYDFDHQ